MFDPARRINTQFGQTNTDRQVSEAIACESAGLSSAPKRYLESTLQRKPVLESVAAQRVSSEQLSNDGVNSLTSPDPAPVEEELYRILASKTFSKSVRLRQLLDYIIKQWLAGRSDQLDGYNLGIAVFGRPNSFDPSLDPIVRVQAARLRNQLSRFYASEGLSTIHIDIPKGGYIPVINRQQLHLCRTTPGLIDSSHVTVIVLPFFVYDDNAQSKGLHSAMSISDQLIYLLTHSPGVRVASRISSIFFPGSRDVRQLSEQLRAEFIVEGTVSYVASDCYVIVHLAETKTCYNLWSGRYTATADNLIVVADQIFHDLIDVIGGAHHRPSAKKEVT